MKITPIMLLSLNQNVGTHTRHYFATESWRIEEIKDAPLASMHFPLVFSHCEIGWHLIFLY